MILVFVRHASYHKPPSREDNRDAPLTEAGREQAAAAGSYMADLGLEPDLVISTATRRTRKTAHNVLRALGAEQPVHIVPHGWRAGASREQIEARVRQWIKFAPTAPETVLFCGHGVQLRSLMRAFSVEPVYGKRHGAVVVVEISDDPQQALKLQQAQNTAPCFSEQD